MDSHAVAPLQQKMGIPIQYLHPHMAGMVSSARMMNSSDRGLNHYRNVSPFFQAISEFLRCNCRKSPECHSLFRFLTDLPRFSLENARRLTKREKFVQLAVYLVLITDYLKEVNHGDDLTIQAVFNANPNLTRKNKCAIMILAREGSCVPARFIF
jgi:hypothetical protein